MTPQYILHLLTLAFVVLWGGSVSGGEMIRSTIRDQKALHLTVYNDNFALISDQRILRLHTGRQQVQFMDIAASIQPESVIVQGEGVRILEQTYEYDLLTPQKLLEKYIGQLVTLVFHERQGGDTVQRRETATLLSTEEGTVWQIGNRIVINPPTSTIEFSTVPPDLIATPTLIWNLESEGGERLLTVSYLANQINWKADYVFTLSADGKTGDLTGWVTLDNRSGVSYQNATLRLIAGEVNRVQAPPRGREIVRAEMTKAVSPVPFEEQAFAEYHLYKLAYPVTIRQNQTKQFPLLQGKGSTVERIYRLVSQPWYYGSRQPVLPKQKVEMVVTLKNSEQNGLGLPLPSGIVRVYQIDDEGNRQFIGEDQIEHRPKDEEVTLSLGSAFDVTAERTQTAYQIIADRVHESSYEITLRNHKKEPITVVIQEHFGGTWKILSHSHPYKQADAFSAEFKIPVPADGQAMLAYRVQIQFR